MSPSPPDPWIGWENKTKKLCALCVFSVTSVLKGAGWAIATSPNGSAPQRRFFRGLEPRLGWSVADSDDRSRARRFLPPPLRSGNTEVTEEKKRTQRKVFVPITTRPGVAGKTNKKLCALCVFSVTSVLKGAVRGPRQTRGTRVRWFLPPPAAPGTQRAQKKKLVAPFLERTFHPLDESNNYKKEKVLSTTPTPP